MNIPYRGSDGPLRLLIDSTGIKVEGEGEWSEAEQKNSPGDCFPAERASMAARNGACGARSTSGSTRVRRGRKGPGGAFPRRTLEIRAADFTASDIGDAPMLPELPDQIPPDQEIATITADGAFDTRKCHDAIAARSAAAVRALSRTGGVRALTPARKNARPWKPDTAGAIARNEILRTSKRVGRTIWRRWSGYHRRSRVEI